VSWFRGWGLYAALLAAIAAGTLAGVSPAREFDSPLPSIENSGPAGLRALFLYLQEAGFDAAPHRAPLTAIAPGDAAVVVLAAPSRRPLTAGEVEHLTDLVERGLTLVYLTPSPGLSPRSALDEWLGLRAGAALPPSGGDAKALIGGGGHPARLPLSGGVLQGLRALRLDSERALISERADAVPVAVVGEDPVGWWVGHGRGEVWVFAGAGLAQSRWLEFEHNLELWHALASRGPLRFDEYHHLAAAPPGSNTLLALALQLVACGLFFAFARGARLGPPRPVAVEHHRSMGEYLHAFGWLLRRAKVERELLPELRARFRARCAEQVGIAPQAPEDVLAQQLERRCGVSATEVTHALGTVWALEAQAHVSARQFAHATRQLAALEAQLRRGTRR
jgi:hypothetical protein